MKKAVILFLFATGSLFSQETISKKIGDFEILKVYNGLHVEMIKSSEQKVMITGRKSDHVVVKNRNGKLKIYLEIPESFSADQVEITLYYNSHIDVIDANEGASISSKNTIKQQHLEVRSQEGARIDLNIDVNYLSSKIITGGYVKVSGIAKNQDVEANSGGHYHAYNLKTKQSNILAATGGVAKINVKDILDAKVRLGGTIRYKGAPEVLKTKKIIGGVIKEKN